ncbi:MAG: DUF1080 domain-containing protein [Planctomycetales bacterium]|nr:DUF1080 domain-containing protein [Planctomycetales bacterium]
MLRTALCFAFSVIFTAGVLSADADTEKVAKDGQWMKLFNGKNLDGWTPKIRYQELGKDPGKTFRVRDGKMVVEYNSETYPEFKETFGHIFYKEKFSHYKIRVEYRFVGDQVKGGPNWAIRNSGIMLHCQDPKTMTKNQDFPVSIEVQLLGGTGSGERTTANLCSPGTNVVLNGKLFTTHCTSSTSATYHGDRWVTVEVEVHGDQVIKHIIDGKVVLAYEQPQLDPRDPTAKQLVKEGGNLLLSEGYISLQSESHPVEFRKVELMRLQ